MNEPTTWTRRRFWVTAGALFLLQGVMILLFGAHGGKKVVASTAPVDFRMLGTPLSPGELSREFLAADPTVFPLPSHHGFSGRAWLRSSAKSKTPDDIEKPAWLEIETAQLGTNFPTLNNSALIPFGLADQRGLQLEPWPVFLAPELVRTQSFFVVQGPRPLNPPSSLPAWPSLQLLTNSVVQIAVDAAGQVMASRLLARSGSPAADITALEDARRLRFRPTPGAGPVWAEAVFAWQTATPATTP
jgi:hypothetical protein